MMVEWLRYYTGNSVVDRPNQNCRWSVMEPIWNPCPSLGPTKTAPAACEASKLANQPRKAAAFTGAAFFHVFTEL